MWLLNVTTHKLESFEGTSVPNYAILSHRWESEEVTFKDVQQGRQKEMKGWEKIDKCCQQALRDGLSHVWADTCCIDKSSSAELSEAINSMYLWYKEAALCYAFLSDVSISVKYDLGELSKCMNTNEASAYGQRCFDTHLHSDFTNSIWFTRGWTLQELLAPEVLIFYDCAWASIGSKRELCFVVHQRTRIQPEALQSFHPNMFSAATMMAWAAGRMTTRPEDRAYSLLGIFDVNMALLYGEREKAFCRLQEEIMRSNVGLSIFAWKPPLVGNYGMLAPSPEYFADNPVLHGSFMELNVAYSVDNTWITGSFNLQRYAFDIYFAYIGCVEAKDGVSFVGILLRRDHYESSTHDEGCFHRVMLGEKSLLTSKTMVFCGDRKTKTIKIRRHKIHRMYDVISARKTFEFKKLSPGYDVAGIQISGFVRPGLLYPASRHEELSASKQVQLNDDNKLLFRRVYTDEPVGCLYFGQQWPHHNDDCSKWILYFGVNFEGAPMAFITNEGLGDTSWDGCDHLHRHFCLSVGCFSPAKDQSLWKRKLSRAGERLTAKTQHHTATSKSLTNLKLATAEILEATSEEHQIDDLLKVYISRHDTDYRVHLQFMKYVEGIEKIPSSWLLGAQPHQK